METAHPDALFDAPPEVIGSGAEDDPFRSSDGSTIDRPAESFTDRLRTLADAKALQRTTAAAAKIADQDYRSLERDVIAELERREVTSIKVDGIGSFSLGHRDFSKVTDWRAMLDWAHDQKLVNLYDPHPQLLDDDEVLISFRLATDVDSDGAEKQTLTSGVVKADLAKARINEHVKELLEAGEDLPPGIEQASTWFVTIRRK